MPSAPKVRVSVVVVGYAPPKLLQRCLTALREQSTDRPDVEVLVVSHKAHQGESFTQVRALFPEFPWIAAPTEHNVARLRGLGIARSRGAIVALLEGDCVPADGWLARLATLEPAAALGGAIEPGAFRRGIDWA